MACTKSDLFNSEQNYRKMHQHLQYQIRFVKIFMKHVVIVHPFKLSYYIFFFLTDWL